MHLFCELYFPFFPLYMDEWCNIRFSCVRFVRIFANNCFLFHYFSVVCLLRGVASFFRISWARLIDSVFRISHQIKIHLANSISVFHQIKWLLKFHHIFFFVAVEIQRYGYGFHIYWNSFKNMPKINWNAIFGRWRLIFLDLCVCWFTQQHALSSLTDQQPISQRHSFVSIHKDQHASEEKGGAL